MLNGTGSYSFNGYMRSGYSHGTLGLEMIGSGTQTLSGNNIYYTGGTTVSSGELVLNAARIFAGTLTNNATVVLSGTSGRWAFLAGQNNVTLAGSGTLVKTGTGIVEFGQQGGGGGATVDMAPGGDCCAIASCMVC